MNRPMKACDMKRNQALKAIILDVDGVLVDSESSIPWLSQVLSEEAINLSAHDYARLYVGLADAECFSAVFATASVSCRRPTWRA
jgi:beta-phosphoglucomutase-like phosphatase (HAD superfamily)